ncbi:hypothetical protein FHS96_005513 [Sphingomonas zeicaulis]|uniref:hypothetical protein n=1 Tax=Sphingomonas zeicaulis TaxID=1632740 RepID=UPI003D23FB0B
MVTLSSKICSSDCGSVQALAAAERATNRAGIQACVDAAIADGTLRNGADSVGLATLFEGVLVGLSIQARDGGSTGALDAAVTQDLIAWMQTVVDLSCPVRAAMVAPGSRHQSVKTVGTS